MSAQTEQLSEINRKNRQRILLLKNRAQKMMSRPSSNNHHLPPTSIPAKTTPSFLHKNVTQYDFLKEYETNKSSNKDVLENENHDYSLNHKNERDGSFDYNSTLFKHIRDEPHTSDKHNQSQFAFMNKGSEDNGSRISDGNDFFRDSNLLSKIDELLNDRKKDKGSVNSLNAVYDEFLQKNSMRSSQALSGSCVSIVSSKADISQYDTRKNDEDKQNINKNKLKTIEEQLPTTIQNKKQQKQKIVPEKNKTKITNIVNEIPKVPKPPLFPLSSSTNIIQRQKRKLQDTLKEMKEMKDMSYNLQEKDSLILQFSDNDSENQTQDNTQICKKNQKNQQNSHSQDNERDSKKKKLILQKNTLYQELKIVQRQLQALQLQQKFEEDDF